MAYRVRNEEKRKAFIEQLSEFSNDRIVYVDETGMDCFLCRKSARAPRGQKVFGLVSGQSYKRVGLVDAQCDAKILSPMDTQEQNKALRLLAAKANCSVQFLPLYSPDLNPIEHFWAWIKYKLKSLLPKADCFNDALTDCFKLEWLYHLVYARGCPCDE